MASEGPAPAPRQRNRGPASLSDFPKPLVTQYTRHCARDCHSNTSDNPTATGHLDQVIYTLNPENGDIFALVLQVRKLRPERQGDCPRPHSSSYLPARPFPSHLLIKDVFNIQKNGKNFSVHPPPPTIQQQFPF